MQDSLQAAILAIDSLLGDGYARKNPELVGRMIQADAIHFFAEIILEYTQGEAIEESPLQ